MGGVEVIDVSVVVTAFLRIRRTLNQVMDLAANPGLFQINLHIRSAHDWLVLLVALAIESDGDQPISREQSRSRSRRVRLDSLGNDPLLSIGPADAVPGWRLAPGSLDEVQHPGSKQHRSASEH